MPAPQLTVVAGPHGAGKSTGAPALLRRGTPYLNADEIAKMLPGPGKDVQAGRILVETWDTLAAQNASFAVETTLATRALATRIKALKSDGYRIRLHFVWLPDVELSIARVTQRARMGGHNVPVDAVIRRYAGGLDRFFDLYLPLVDEWRFYDNSRTSGPRRIANGSPDGALDIFDVDIWNAISPDGAHVKVSEPPTIPDLPVDTRLRAAIRKDLQLHKRKGNPVSEWRDGKLKWVRL